MIRLTTDKNIREKIEREMRYRDEMRWQSERIEKLEMRMYELERRLDNLNPPVAVNREKVTRPAIR